MGVSLVARVEGVGVDAFQLIADRLSRDHQAPPKERWISVMRSFRQPLPPLENDPEPSLPSQSTSNDQTRSKKQRSMYCFRHSARPREFVAMIEDANAPNRPFQPKNPEDSRSGSFATNLESSKNLEPVPNSSSLESIQGTSGDQNHDHESQQVDQPLANNINITEATQPPGTNPSGSILMETNTDVTNIPELSATIEPSHYRISIISVPESFEPLLTSAICAPQANLVPSAWCPRPNYVAIEGMAWGIYNSSFELDTASSNFGPVMSDLSSRETQPDWWVRLGTVTNKGATSGNTSLPWLILEIECANSLFAVDPSFAFLESVMRALIKPNDRLVVRPYRPTRQNLVEAGLMSETSDHLTSQHLPKTVTLQNSYCMLMLAKEEGLI